MACQGCEERRQKLKALYDNSKESIANAIARIADRNRKAEQPSDSTEQSVDSTAIDSKQSDSAVTTTDRARPRRTKRTKISG